VRVDPAHGVVSHQGSRAGQVLVQHDAQAVEVGALVDDAVHATGLFGRDAGQPNIGTVQRDRRQGLAPDPHAVAKAQQPGTTHTVHQDLVRINTRVNCSGPMNRVQRSRQPKRQAQEDIDRGARVESTERHAARVR